MKTLRRRKKTRRERLKQAVTTYISIKVAKQAVKTAKDRVPVKPVAIAAGALGALGIGVAARKRSNGSTPAPA
jgi:hypothetical protein